MPGQAFRAQIFAAAWGAVEEDAVAGLQTMLCKTGAGREFLFDPREPSFYTFRQDHVVAKLLNRNFGEQWRGISATRGQWAQILRAGGLGPTFGRTKEPFQLVGHLRVAELLLLIHDSSADGPHVGGGAVLKNAEKPLHEGGIHFRRR